MNSEQLAIQLELQTSKPSPAGSVVLINRGSAEIRVWRTGNTWGDEVLSFEVLHDTQIWHFVRQLGDYTRNVPASLTVPAGDSHRLSFDLGDGTWESDAPVDQV